MFLMDLIQKLKNKYINLPIQLKASIWFLFCTFMQKGVSIITTPIFTRLLTTAEYGQYSVYTSWFSILLIFFSFRLWSDVYTQGLVKFTKEKNIYASSLLGLSTVSFILFTLIYLIFKSFFNNILGLSTTQVLLMILSMFCVTCFYFWSYEQRVDCNYRMLVVVTCIASILKPVLSIILIFSLKNNVTARILGIVMAEFICYTWCYFYQMKKGKTFYSAKFWKYALAFNIPLIPHYLSQAVLNSSDRIMISSMIGNSEAGIYGLAYQISQVTIIFNNALTQTINPWIYQKIKEKRTQDIAGVAYIALIGIAAVNILLIIFAPELVRFFAPTKYYEAINIIPPISMAVIFMFSYDLFAKFAFYFERSSFVMLASVIGALLNVVLNYICIGIFGYFAAAYTTLACYIFYAIAHYWFMRKTCKEELNNIKVYNPKILMTIYLTFMSLGFIFLLTYDHIIIRYSLFLLLIVICIINRKRIIDSFKLLLAIRKNKKAIK